MMEPQQFEAIVKATEVRPKQGVQIERVHKATPSCAGANSGEFHKYRFARRREFDRLGAMEEEEREEMERRQLAEKVERNRAEAEERTRRNAEKRKAKKEKKKSFKKQKVEGAETSEADQKEKDEASNDDIKEETEE